MRKYALFSIAVIVIAALVIAKPGAHKPGNNGNEVPDTGISVRVGYPHMGVMTEETQVSGDLKALKSVVLSAKISGRVVAVPYREGDSVGAGTAVVRQDTSDIQTQVQQAEAALQSAKARLSQAQTSEGLSDTQTEAQIAQAQAGLDAAKARLRMIKSGARTQERAQAENAVASAKANFENAKINLERMRDLYSQGALSKQQMDLVQMQYDIAAAQHDSAKQQLSLVTAGAREEEIEAAEKQVSQAEEALRIAKANRSQKSLREEDVKSAKAGVAQAEASLAYARQQLLNARIATPIAGTVARRMIEPGEMASPGIPLMEVVALNSVYFEAAVSEIDVHKVKVGQPVEVAVDALPGRKFRGSVLKVLPTADVKTRQFTVHINVLNNSGELKPGMFCRGSIEVARHANSVIIPKDALMSSKGSNAVYSIADGTARLVPVTLGFMNRDKVEVLSGVNMGDTLVVVGQDKLSDGVKVHVAD